MADPVKPELDYSYTGFQQETQDRPFPGNALDNDLAELKRAADDTIDALKSVRRADGKLQNRVVTRDSLAADLVVPGEGLNPDVYDPNGIEADVFDRANHSGTQSADTITDGTTNKAYTAAEKTALAGKLSLSGGVMTGPLTTQHMNIHSSDVAVISVAALGPGGHEYRIASTDNANGLGGGLFVIYDQTIGSQRMVIDAGGNVSVPGSFAKGSGTFLIDHPLDPANRDLAHGFVEAPRYDLIYRGHVHLEAGRALVDIDVASNMQSGTFVALTTDADTFVSNASGFTPVRATIVGATLTIEAVDPACTDLVSWMVIAERNDAFVRSDLDPNTDADGRFIPERSKADPPNKAAKPRAKSGYKLVERVAADRIGRRGAPRHYQAFGVDAPTETVRVAVEAPG